jgi:hypothetical protein
MARVPLGPQPAQQLLVQGGQGLLLGPLHRHGADQQLRRNDSEEASLKESEPVGFALCRRLQRYDKELKTGRHLARSLSRREDWPRESVGARRSGGDLFPFAGTAGQVNNATAMLRLFRVQKKIAHKRHWRDAREVIALKELFVDAWLELS